MTETRVTGFGGMADGTRTAIGEQARSEYIHIYTVYEDEQMLLFDNAISSKHYGYCNLTVTRVFLDTPQCRVRECTEREGTGGCARREERCGVFQNRTR